MRWGRDGGTSLGIVVGGVCLAIALHSLGISFSELLRALALTAITVLPLGYLLTGGGASAGLTRGERFVLASLVGYPVSSALYYFLALLHASPAYPFALAGAAVAAAALRRPPAPRQGEDGLGGAFVLLLGLAVLALTWGNRAFVPTGGGVAYRHPIDYPLHLAVYWELLRGIPPRELPTVAGVAFPHYHVFGYMLGIVLTRYGGLEPVMIYHVVMPVLHLGLLLGAVSLAVRARSGDRRLAAAAVIALCFVSGALERLLARWLVTGAVPFEFFVRSVSGGGGIVVWASVFCLLVLHDRECRQHGPSAGRELLYLSSVLVGLSYFFKAQSFLVFGAAYFAALGALYLRDRSRVLLVAGALAGVIAAVTAMSWRATTSSGALAYVPGLFAREHVFPALRDDPGPLLSRTLGALESLPDPLRGLLATSLGFWRVLNLSLLVPLYWVSRARGWRSADMTDAVLVLLLPLAFVITYGLAAADVNGLPGAQAVREALYAFPMLAAVVDVCVLAALLERAGLRGSRVALAATLGAALALVPSWAIRRSDGDPTSVLFLSRGEQAALAYLRRETPLDAVVVSARSRSFPDLAQLLSGLDRYAVIAGFAGRRSVAERYGPGLEQIDPARDRIRDVRRLFSTMEEAVALRILGRYGVDYILEYSGLPLKFPKSQLELCFDGGDVRVHRVKRGGGSKSLEVRIPGNLRAGSAVLSDKARDRPRGRRGADGDGGFAEGRTHSDATAGAQGPRRSL